MFTEPGNAWATMTQTATLTAAGGAAGDEFGSSVATGADVVVESPGVSGGQGAAYVFAAPSNGWVNATQTATLTATGGAAGDRFGTSVSISSLTVLDYPLDTVVVGPPGAASDSGEGYVFSEYASAWADMSQSATLAPTSPATGDGFGGSVSIYNDTVIVGAADTQVGIHNDQGEAYESNTPYGYSPSADPHGLRPGPPRK